MDVMKKYFNNKTYCISGFSDNQDIKNKLSEKYQAKFSDTTTNQTDFVIVKEKDKPYPSSKIKMAYKYNIPILEYNELINITY